LFAENSYQCNFDVNICSNYENLQQHRYLSELVDFIHAARLNKTTTSSLLSLLRATNPCTTRAIPKTTHALWEQLDVKFTFKTFYFCSVCFNELHQYQDICSICNFKSQANSELCIFSLADELKRVVKSTIDVIHWYSVPEHQIVSDIINGKLRANIF